MKKTIQLTIAALVTIGLAVTVPAITVGAAELDPCKLDTGSSLCTDKTTDLGPVFKAIVNVLLFIIGAVSVVMIIVSGLRYATSGGNSSGVASAKNTLIYAVVGLVVAIFAYAIVNFVIGRALNT